MRSAAKLAVAVFWVCRSTVSAEPVLPSLDLDSLAFSSDAIVEGQVVDAELSGEAAILFRVRIDRPLKGPVHAKQVISVRGIDWFRHAPDLTARSREWDKVGVGDHVVLFLRDDDDSERTEPVAAKWCVSAGGMFLIDRDRVYGFAQRFVGEGTGTVRGMAPHGYVAITPDTYPLCERETRDRFEKRLHGSFATVDDAHALMHVADERSVARLFQLAERRDARLVRDRASLQDPRVRASPGFDFDAIPAIRWRDPFGELLKGQLSSTEGRWGAEAGANAERLLRRRPRRRDRVTRDLIGWALNSPALPPRHRNELLAAVPAALAAYREDLRARELQGTADFVMRLATGATQAPGTESAARILAAIGAMSRDADAAERAGLLGRDLDAAGDVLANAFAFASPRGRLQLATALQSISPAAALALAPSLQLVGIRR